MLLTIKYKGYTFYKNSGSQDFVLKTTADDETTKLVHIKNKNQGLIWGAVKKNDILRLIKKNIGLYEVISEYPCKVYFDIDGEEGETIELDKIKNIIRNYFGEDVKMAISGYTGTKISYHICLYEYGINSADDLNELKALATFINKNEYSCFDWKVYTKNRNMKAINQSKPNKPTQMIIEDDDEEHHLITFYTDSIKYNLPKFSVTNPKIETVKLKDSSLKMDYSTLPKLELELSDDIDLTKPLEVLNIIPINPSFDHRWTWRTALFCATNKLTCNDFLKWYKNKNDDTAVLDKWKFIHWPNVIKSVEQYPVTLNSMLKTLQCYYPNILLRPDLRQFVNKFNINNEGIRYTNYLTLDDFETDKKSIIINIQMGGGKTHNTIQYLKTHDNFCWITPNIALAQNTHNRILNEDIECVNYQHGKNLDERKEKIGSAFNLIVCLNSLKYVKQNYDVIVIDEIETFLKLWFNNSTLSKCLDECWVTFIQLLKSAKKIILLDAFLSKITTDFLDSLSIDYIIIKKQMDGTLRNVIKYKNFKHIYSKMEDSIKSGNKCLIFYPYKNYQDRNDLPSMAGLVQTIEKISGKKGMYHNADAADSNNKMLENVNENWVNYDFVVSNNKINVGLNFDIDYFDEVYLMVAGFNSPRDIVQFSYRTRTLTKNVIHYCLLNKYNPCNDFFIQKVETHNEVFQSLFKNVILEKRSPVEETMEFFFAKANYITNDFSENPLNDEKLIFDNMDYYDYDNLKNVGSDDVKQLNIKMCCMTSSTEEKLLVKKFYYERTFKMDTPSEIKADIWNGNKINFMENCLNVLYNNEVMTKLKDNYKWALHFPEEIRDKFKFNKEDIELIFNDVDFKYLKKDKSSHTLILNNYLNTIYGVDLFRKSKTHKLYKVNETLKDIYINVVDYHDAELYSKINGKGCLIDTHFSECL
jgi:hypothetical protein